MRDEFGVRDRFITQPDFETTSTAKPANFMRADQSIFSHITSAAKNNISKSELVLRQPLHVRLVNPHNTVLNDATITDVGWHHDRNSKLPVVRCM